MPNIMAIFGGGAGGPHKTTHQDGGTDEINATGLTGRLNFVHRGDPAAWDWDQTTLTADGTWKDLDCSAIVPAGAKIISFRGNVCHAAICKQFSFRVKGNTHDMNAQYINTQVANLGIGFNFQLPCDANRFVQYLLDNSAYQSLLLLITGWWI